MTNQAVYFPATKLVVSGDPYYLKQVPITEIREVRVEPIRPYFAWFVAAVMIAAGLFGLISIVMPFILHIEGTYRVNGAPLALLAGGILLPFVARGRKQLVVAFQKGAYRWTPPMVVDGESKKKVRWILEQVLDAAKRAGVPAVDASKTAG